MRCIRVTQADGMLSPGLWIEFENGLTVSIQWSPWHYGNCRLPLSQQPDINEMRKEPVCNECPHLDHPASIDAEVAVIYEHELITGQLADTGDDTVLGWATPDQVASIIEKAQAWEGPAQ